MSEAVETGVPDRADARVDSSAELFDRVHAWRAQDPDAETGAELDALLASAKAGNTEAVAELRSRFDQRLEFGTAGLRGRIEAGPNRMNRVLVSQAAAGLAAYLLQKEHHRPNGRTPSVVIGYDGRRNSRVFATDTAEILAGVGVRAILLPRLLPTPVLAFAVRHLDASAGVMVTASHNPPNDNGYKVYLGGDDHGSQIVPPADADIAHQILLAATNQNVLDMPRAAYDVAGEDVLDQYVLRTAAISSTALSSTPISSTTAPSETPATELRFVYTAMHGVGWETASRVFTAAGFGQPIVVAEQIEPDPTFHTVAFPNPEEPGAMDLAFATATEADADVIIANDPDADRLAVAVPDAGGWRRLSGNEVGSLLGWRIAERLWSADKEGALAASIVSSPALQEIARRYRLDYADTLTGFKWVSRVPGLAYGYEEALGYLVDPEKVRDKDGISAAVEFLGLMSELKSSGTSFGDHENAFAEKFGAYASSQISLRMTDLAEIPRIMNRIRQNPPASIGESKVDRIDDFSDGFDEFPPGDILRIWLADGSRIILRPSGTEPKLKVYIDASSTAGTASERRSNADAAVAGLDAAMRRLLA